MSNIGITKADVLRHLLVISGDTALCGISVFLDRDAVDELLPGIMDPTMDLDAAGKEMRQELSELSGGTAGYTWKCHRCNKLCRSMKCKSCKARVYCSRNCQLEDWPDHRVFCKKNRHTTAVCAHCKSPKRPDRVVCGACHMKIVNDAMLSSGSSATMSQRITALYSALHPKKSK
jgi:hypothetical protein